MAKNKPYGLKITHKNGYTEERWFSSDEERQAVENQLSHDLSNIRSVRTIGKPGL